MNLFGMFLTVAVAHFLALLSPGPDFVLIVKSAIRTGRRKNIGVAAGIAGANAVYIGLCLIGVGSVLASSANLMLVLRIAGGIFLVYLAIMSMKVKKDSYSQLTVVVSGKQKLETSFAGEFLVGFTSGILNPKNLLFYLSLFSVVLTADVDFTFRIALGVWMASVVFLWDVAVTCLLSTNRVLRKFSSMAYYIDKLTGMVLGMIGVVIIKLALTE